MKWKPAVPVIAFVCAILGAATPLWQIDYGENAIMLSASRHPSTNLALASA